MVQRHFKAETKRFDKGGGDFATEADLEAERHTCMSTGATDSTCPLPSPLTW